MSNKPVFINNCSFQQFNKGTGHTCAETTELQSVWCVQVHGGDISVRSADNEYKGLTVRVDLGGIYCD